MIYADPEQGQWIALVAGEPLEAWQNAERTTLAATSSLSDARIRVVFDPDELRERLAIWDRGLDDAVIECVKLRCLAEQPGIRGPRERLRVTAIEDDGTLAFSIRSREGVPRAAFRVAASVVNEVSRDVRWRERFPALFENGFVSIDRYLVA